MSHNLSKRACKVGFYFCWVIILMISAVYLSTTTGPWSTEILGTIKTPDLDPLIYTNHRAGLMKVPPIGTKLNLEQFYKRKKEVEFYSTVDHEAYAEIFYRPDFQN